MADDDYDVTTIIARVAVTLIFGGLLLVGWRLFSGDRSPLHLPRRSRSLLTVEDAVRWRPEI